MTDSDFLRALSKDVFTRADQKVIDLYVSKNSKSQCDCLLNQCKKTDAWWYCMLVHFIDDVNPTELARYMRAFVGYTYHCTLRAYLMNKNKPHISLSDFTDINEVVKYIPKNLFIKPSSLPVWYKITLDTWKILIDRDVRFLDYAPPEIKEHPEITCIIPKYPYLLEPKQGSSMRIWSRLTQEQCWKIIYDFENSNTTSYSVYADELCDLVDTGYLPCDILLRTKIDIWYDGHDFTQVECRNPLLQYMLCDSAQCVELIATEYPLYLLILMNLGHFRFEKRLRRVPPNDRFRKNFVFAYDRCKSYRDIYKNMFKRIFHANIDYEPRYKRVFDISDFATNTHSQLDPDMCIAAVIASADNIKYVKCYGDYVYDFILQRYPNNIGNARYLPERILKKIAKSMPNLMIKLIDKIPNIIKYRPYIVLKYAATDEHWVIAINKCVKLLEQLKSSAPGSLYKRILPQVNYHFYIPFDVLFDLLEVNDMIYIPPKRLNDKYNKIKNSIIAHNKFVTSWKPLLNSSEPPKPMIKWAHHNTEYLFFDGNAKSLMDVYNPDKLSEMFT